MKRDATRKIVIVSIMVAVGFVLMLLDFPLPMLIPSFVKMDLSELPPLITAFAFGPLMGAIVCFGKNLLHLTVSSSGGVGELCNFLLGVCFVVPAGFIYKKRKNMKGALIGSLVGAAVMALASFPINYYIVYPFYSKFMPIDLIVKAYGEIWSFVDSLPKALWLVSVPFNFFVKGLLTVIITFLVYKKLSPVLKGRK